MVTFEVVSEQDCLVDGIGELKAGEPRIVTPYEAERFRLAHGYTLAESRFPESVQVTASVTENEDAETPDEEGGE